MKLRNALLAATILAAPVAVKAQPVVGPYVSLGAGWNYLQDEDISSVSVGGLTTATSGSAKFGSGFVGLGAVGWGLGNGLRVELEGDYRDNKQHALSGAAGAGGDEIKIGAMVNALYDFNVGWPVVPYVGVGVGYQHVGLMDGSYYGYNPNYFVRVQNPKDAFGYQASSAPPQPADPGPRAHRRVSLPRHRRRPELQEPGLRAGRRARRATSSTTNDYNHAILIGLRYAFNAAPPPPPPAPAAVAAPAPAPARSYLVFFDWDRADLTDRARQIIAEAAQTRPASSTRGSR